MEDMVAEPGQEPTMQDRVARWWPVAIAISSTMVLPYLGIPFALVMAFIRRWDRPVMVSLIVVALLGVLLLSLLLSAGGDGVGTAS